MCELLDGEGQRLETELELIRSVTLLNFMNNSVLNSVFGKCAFQKHLWVESKCKILAPYYASTIS